MSDMNGPKDGVLKGEESLLLDHNYDGIKELDHVLPRWWLGILFGTIIFSAWYVAYYMTGYGPNPNQELAEDLERIEKLKPVAVAAAGEDVFAAAVKDGEKVRLGASVFTTKCAACHGDKGQGVIGPNLTDDFWIHGKGSMSDVAQTITNGVPEKGMPPWGQVLSPDDLRNVTVYIHTLHGSNPAGAKAPQGEKQDFKE